MKVDQRVRLALLGVLALTALAGCGRDSGAVVGSVELLSERELGTSVGVAAKVAGPEPVPVEGYGLVGGLAGTGAPTCPPAVRQYLERYIRVQLPIGGVDVGKLIDSRNTAVVQLTGVIPAAASKDDRFDVRVSLIAGSDATSLRGGWLYRAELKRRGTFAVATRNLAIVEGPVFINVIGVSRPDLRDGHILGGGRVLEDYRGAVLLERVDFRLASQIRNRINERYGSSTAEALAPALIGLRIPPEYRWRKERFIAMVAATYLEQTPELIEARLNTFLHQLAVAEDRERPEIALEALGRESLSKLGTLLHASQEEVRLRAARCMLALGDDRGLATVRQIALDPNATYRREALEAVAVCGKRNDASALAGRLLRDRDPVLVLSAYEHLRRLGDPGVTQEFVGRSFHLEQIAETDHKVIYMTRSGEPRVVIFGAPLLCKDNFFADSPDGAVIVDSQTGQGFVSIVRHHPTEPGVVGPVRTGFDLSDIVRAMGSEPVQTKNKGLYGLGLSYTDVTAIVKQLVDKDAIRAEFWAGPLPQSDRIIKK